MRLQALFLVLPILGCASPKVLRDARVYTMELEFLQMSITKTTDLLEEHLLESCTCAHTRWTSPLCEETAKTILLLRARIPYHIGLMKYNAGLQEHRPVDLPEVGDPSELCSTTTPKGK